MVQYCSTNTLTHAGMLTLYWPCVVIKVVSLSYISSLVQYPSTGKYGVGFSHFFVEEWLQWHPTAARLLPGRCGSARSAASRHASTSGSWLRVILRLSVGRRAVRHADRVQRQSRSVG